MITISTENCHLEWAIDERGVFAMVLHVSKKALEILERTTGCYYGPFKLVGDYEE